ncbi:contractile injection system tape measure protein [Undibacterium sp. Di26W]|uniref:contractile injection system tape measure protein n=1 Tax=Undibacterium sp. Di26W TaxID=3413035 RepID=UPI003BF2C374
MYALRRYVATATHNRDNMNTTFNVNNSGLVLLQSYIPLFFSRLHLTVDDRFVSADAQQRAVHYLQFLATGHSQTADHYLVLNKILCGFKPQDTVDTNITMPTADKELCESLLHAAISHWTAIGASSLDGMRGNWLVRDGLLSENGEWQLAVEKRAYDILINKSPFSFSVIKFPWMNKVLRVSWPS